MSVINQMLKDLEHRQGQASPAARLVESLGVRTERLVSDRSTGIWWLILPASAALLAASFLWNKGRSDTAVPASTVASVAKPAGNAVNKPVVNERLQTAVESNPKQEKLLEPPVEPAVQYSEPPGVPSAAQPAEPESPVQAADAPVVSASVFPPNASSRPVAAKPASLEEQAEVIAPATDIKRPANTGQLANSHYQRALEYLQAARIDPAIVQLREAVRLQSGMHAARELLANLYLRTGRQAEAYMLLKEGLDASPQYLPFAKMYARTLIEQGQLPVAKRALENSLLYAGGDADYQALLAAVEQRLGDHGAAVTRYMLALELNKRQGAWWVGMGISLEALGRAAEAGQAYKAARASPGLSAELIAYIETRLKQLGS